MKLEATFNAIIVKPIEVKTTSTSRIIVPDMENGKNETGEIISVGKGHYSGLGNFIPTTLKEGQKVILPTMGFTKFTFDGEEYYVGPENQILGLVELEK